jgi:hypothetical protein
VNGAGVWTLADDEAADGSGGAVKDCYIVDCPGLDVVTQDVVDSAQRRVGLNEGRASRRGGCV